MTRDAEMHWGREITAHLLTTMERFYQTRMVFSWVFDRPLELPKELFVYRGGRKLVTWTEERQLGDYASAVELREAIRPYAEFFSQTELALDDLERITQVIWNYHTNKDLSSHAHQLAPGDPKLRGYLRVDEEGVPRRRYW